MENIKTIAVQSKQASLAMQKLSLWEKNNILTAMAEKLDKNRGDIFRANQIDLDQAGKIDLAPPLLKRLKFDDAKIEESLEGISSLIRLEDPVGKTLSAMELDNGLELFKVSRPIGVIGIIFESRPDALVQITSLCLKSGNAVLLKGGSEAANTNKILAGLLYKAGIENGLPQGWLCLLESREDVAQMLELDQYLDLIIPRGSNSFVRHIMENTLIPVLGHADGICHLYIDKSADPVMAVNIAVDGKTQYAAVCNAIETILIHKDIAKAVLNDLVKVLKARNVKILGCEKTCKIVKVLPAKEEDWATEYLDYIVSVKIVDGMEQAVDHINQYGSGHTDVIVTRDKKRAVDFMNMADTADVFWNCSSRFADGFRFGLGAEVGISTGKIHARGPVGLDGLVTCQWRLIGDGHCVADYIGDNCKKFLHKSINKNFE